MAETLSQSGAGDRERCQALLRALHPCISITTREEADALAVVRDAAIEVSRQLWVWSFNGGVRDGLVASSPPIADTERPVAGIYHLATLGGPFSAALLDVAGHLKDERTLRLLRDLISVFAHNGSTLFLIDHQELPPVIRDIATEFELSLPDEQELEDLLRTTLREQNDLHPIQIDISRQGVLAVLRNLRGLTRRQARQIIIDVVSDDRRFDLTDVNRILAEKRRALKGAGLLEYMESPVALDEIGGLKRLKNWLQTRHSALTREAEAFGLTSPRGILMLGVQGAGKSLAAKAVATAWQLPLMRMDVGSLYDKYIGESERRLRDSLKQAEMMSPVILWVDEIEKAFASAASRSTDGGLSQRMFGMMLTWMQERTAPVFLIATANDIEALPPELLRKGRFDEIFFVDLPDLEARQQIFGVHLKKRKREPAEFDLASLAEASAGYSGAEIEQAVIAGLHAAFAGRRAMNTADVLEALKNSPPLSVTMAERVEALREWAKGRCVPAD